jgi:hypothetical protein
MHHHEHLDPEATSEEVHFYYIPVAHKSSYLLPENGTLNALSFVFRAL